MNKAKAVIKNGQLESYDSGYKKPVELNEENKEWLNRILSGTNGDYYLDGMIDCDEVESKLLEMQKQLAEKDAVIAELNNENKELRKLKFTFIDSEYSSEHITKLLSFLKDKSKAVFGND